MGCLGASSYHPSSAPYRITRANVVHTQLMATPFKNSFTRKYGIQIMAIASTQNPKKGRHTIRNERIMSSSSSEVVEELFAVMELVADRAEMHRNIGIQRDNWNRLLLSSVNGMTFTAVTMTGLASVSTAIGVTEASFLALKLCSTILYLAATGVLIVMNKIQPSQLAEEQRNAARLFKQLHGEINTTLSLKEPTANDVNEIMEKVLALDKAYPLPLLGTMLDKFPNHVEPAVWWPKTSNSAQQVGNEYLKMAENGWSENLEEEMREIVGVLKRKDATEYVRLSKIVLKVNKILAICGPLCTGLAAIGSAFVGSGAWFGSWAVLMGVVLGAMATVVNSLEHGGQVGMVFEMYRSSAGFFTLMEESIESTLKGEVDGRENGQVFEAKVALKLGRSVSELRDLASNSASHSTIPEAKQDFASKLF